MFSKLDCKPRWRERLPELAIPTLVVHGRRDPFFPVGNGEALAREIPGARLLVLEQAATAIPDAAAGEVAAAMLELQALANHEAARAVHEPGHVDPPVARPVRREDRSTAEPIPSRSPDALDSRR